MVRYFWKGRTDWFNPKDYLFIALLGVILYLSARYVWFSHMEDGSIHYLACLMCLSAALSYRRIYLNNAPEDLDLYERECQLQEETDTFVTVA